MFLTHAVHNLSCTKANIWLFGESLMVNSLVKKWVGLGHGWSCIRVEKDLVFLKKKWFGKWLRNWLALRILEDHFENVVLDISKQHQHLRCRCFIKFCKNWKVKKKYSEILFAHFKFSLILWSLRVGNQLKILIVHWFSAVCQKC